MTTATIHQVNYIPWLGFFSKAKDSDIFVMFDDARYSKNNFMNRNSIRTAGGWTYLTIPIERKYYRKPLCQVMLPHDDRWKEDHWKAILFNYNRAEFFHDYSDFFDGIYNEEHRTLVEFNEKIILYLFKQFGVKAEVVRTTELGIDTSLRKTDMLLDILKRVRATSYISGEGGKDYIDEEMFRKSGIELRFQEFEHPTYKQAFEGFIPRMSAIDALFNLGKGAAELI
jgi:hypothetical protein